MALPLIPVGIALLLGTQAPAGYSVLTGLFAARTTIDGVETSYQKICPQLDAAQDKFADLAEKEHWRWSAQLNTAVAVADAMCSASQGSPGVVMDARIVAAAISVLVKAKSLPATPVAPAVVVPSPIAGGGSHGR